MEMSVLQTLPEQKKNLDNKQVKLPCDSDDFSYLLSYLLNKTLAIKIKFALKTHGPQRVNPYFSVSLT